MIRVAKHLVVCCIAIFFGSVSALGSPRIPSDFSWLEPYVSDRIVTTSELLGGDHISTFRLFVVTSSETDTYYSLGSLLDCVNVERERNVPAIRCLTAEGNVFWEILIWVRPEEWDETSWNQWTALTSLSRPLFSPWSQQRWLDSLIGSRTSSFCFSFRCAPPSAILFHHTLSPSIRTLLRDRMEPSSQDLIPWIRWTYDAQLISDLRIGLIQQALLRKLPNRSVVRSVPLKVKWQPLNFSSSTGVLRLAGPSNSTPNSSSPSPSPRLYTEVSVSLFRVSDLSNWLASWFSPSFTVDERDRLHRLGLLHQH
jgi:hypothetical protein